MRKIDTRTPEEMKQQMESFAYMAICSSDTEYPRNLSKHESPDWTNENLGLEIVEAISEEELELFYNTHIDKNLMGDIIDREYKYDSVFEFIYKSPQGLLLFTYHTRTRCVSYGRLSESVDTLDEKTLALIKKCPIYKSLHEDPFLNTYSTQNKIYRVIKEKVGKLQGYSSENCDLCVYCDAHIPSSGRELKKLLKWMQEEMVGRRNFRRIYIIILNSICRFDIAKGEIIFSFIDSNSLTELALDIKLDKCGQIPKETMLRLPLSNSPHIVDLDSEFPPDVQIFRGII